MNNLKISFLIYLFFLNGCVAGLDVEEVAKADYGSFQTPEQCRKITENKIKSKLKDPLTAKFNHDSCSKGYMALTGLPVEFGYLQTGSVNSKDSSGAYTGFTRYNVLIKNGLAVRYCLVTRGEGPCWPKP
jgi:hypothetical protein